MPPKADLVGKIGEVLRKTGGWYSSAGSRDKHYAVWIFALMVEEGGAGSTLHDLRTHDCAVFRGKPGDLEGPVSYTWARIEGPRKVWEAHVDVNVLGKSGAVHGVDVVLLPQTSANRARGSGWAPDLGTEGVGVEAKCFGVARLSPNEGRVTLGFHQEVGGIFWLVANQSNDQVKLMLGKPGRRTALFADAAPGSAAEADLKLAIRSALRQ